MHLCLVLCIQLPVLLICQLCGVLVVRLGLLHGAPPGPQRRSAIRSGPEQGCPGARNGCSSTVAFFFVFKFLESLSQNHGEQNQEVQPDETAELLVKTVPVWPLSTHAPGIGRNLKLLDANQYCFLGLGLFSVKKPYMSYRQTASLMV